MEISCSFMFCTFLLAQKGTQKRPPPLNTPKRRDGALIKLLYYCSAQHLSPDFLHKM
jgi:hypothetical protein